MRRLCLTIAFLTSALVGTAHAQQAVLNGVQPSAGGYDPIGPNGLSINTISVGTTVIGTTGAVTPTLPAVPGKTNYLCGFSVDATATAATDGELTITGLSIGTFGFIEVVAATASFPFFNNLTKTFSPCIAASAANTATVVNTIAPGAAGATYATVWGFVR